MQISNILYITSSVHTHEFANQDYNPLNAIKPHNTF